jgi:hypothetical protein
MEFKMKNPMRRHVLALMLGFTALGIAVSASHHAYAQDSQTEHDDSAQSDSAAGDDGPGHDANDDNGAGDDDGPGHDANDDSGDRSDDDSSNSSSGGGNSDCAVASVNCSKKPHKK